MDEQRLAKAIAELISAAGSTSDARKSRGKASPGKKTKRPRAPSAYNMEFAKQMKALKKKHPRTPATKLMARAHKATKKKRKGRK